MKVLSDKQASEYRERGYVFPFPALQPDELAKYRSGLARLETWLGKPLTEAEIRYRGLGHLFLPWLDDLVRHPRVLDAVEDLVGEDILVYMCTIFIKEPKSGAFTYWHQDSTYFGLRPYEHVTAWVALEDASREAGCMDIVPFDGAPRQLYHTELRNTGSLSSRGQSIAEPIDESRAVAMELKAGQFSLHNTLAPHRSGPNQANHRRIGIGVSYIPTRVRFEGSNRMAAALVRGTDRYGHFDLLPRPVVELGEAEFRVHTRAYDLFRSCNEELAAEHEREFGPAARGRSVAH